MNIVRSWREQRVMLKWRYPILDDFDFVFEEGEEKKCSQDWLRNSIKPDPNWKLFSLNFNSIDCLEG